MQVSIIYRCCELETGNKPKRECRPHWFSKEKSLKNYLQVFDSPNVTFYAIHDGPIGPLYNILTENNIKIEKIDYCSNSKSLNHCLDFAKDINKTDIIYFLEDDYLHTQDALSVLIEGFDVCRSSNNKNIISLYDSLDRYTRFDDIDFHKTLIRLGKTKYWRTAESTTCTWAISQDLYNSEVHKEAKKFNLSDRELFRHLRYTGTILFTPMTGSATHCHEPFLSPLIDWSKY